VNFNGWRYIERLVERSAERGAEGHTLACPTVPQLSLPAPRSGHSYGGTNCDSEMCRRRLRCGAAVRTRACGSAHAYPLASSRSTNRIRADSVTAMTSLRPKSCDGNCARSCIPPLRDRPGAVFAHDRRVHGFRCGAGGRCRRCRSGWREGFCALADDGLEFQRGGRFATRGWRVTPMPGSPCIGRRGWRSDSGEFPTAIMRLPMRTAKDGSSHPRNFHADLNARRPGRAHLCGTLPMKRGRMWRASAMPAAGANLLLRLMPHPERFLDWTRHRSGQIG